MKGTRDNEGAQFNPSRPQFMKTPQDHVEENRQLRAALSAIRADVTKMQERISNLKSTVVPTRSEDEQTIDALNRHGLALIDKLDAAESIGDSPAAPAPAPAPAPQVVSAPLTRASAPAAPHANEEAQSRHAAAAPTKSAAEPAKAKR